MNDIYTKILRQKVKRAYRETENVCILSKVSESPLSWSSGRAEPLKKGRVVRLFGRQERAPPGKGAQLRTP